MGTGECNRVNPFFRSSGGNRNQLIPAGGLFPDETDDSFLRLPAVAFDRDRRPEGKVYVPSGVQRAEVGKNFPPRQEIGFECERQEFDFGGAGQFDRDGVEPLRNEFGVAAAFRKDQDGAAFRGACAPPTVRSADPRADCFGRCRWRSSPASPGAETEPKRCCS